MTLMLTARNWILLAALVAGLATLNGCIDPPGGASDVPCVTVSEWDGALSFRLHDDGILVTVQTETDLRADGADGGINHIPHSVVYRFDAATEEFSAVADSPWDESTEPVKMCCLHVLGEGMFGADDEVLRYDGDAVAVGGGVYITMSPSPTRRFIAAMSTSGRVRQFNVTTGQHFHQVFSVDTGERVGPVLRVGVAGSAGLNWTLDERFVVYSTSYITDRGTRVCVVDRERHGG